MVTGNQCSASLTEAANGEREAELAAWQAGVITRLAAERSAAAASASRPRAVAVVPAGGVGRRLGGPVPKQYLPFGAGTVLDATVLGLLQSPQVAGVLVVVAPDEKAWQQCASLRDPRVLVWPFGGASRRDSVLAGLQCLHDVELDPATWVMVHDAARPGIDAELVHRLLDALQAHPLGALLALPVADTLKRADAQGAVAATLPRDGVWAAQTPQIFRLTALLAALRDHPDATDEAVAMEASGVQPGLVLGSLRNLKLTTAQDQVVLERLLTADRRNPEQSNPPSPDAVAGTDVSAPASKLAPAGLRIGEGHDVHALVPGRPLILGGVTIPHHAGLLGHSDADALCHAVTDALLGAAGLGDIGQHFPDTDLRWRGADSRQLLRHAYSLVQAAGLQVINLDCTVIAQAPKLAPFVPSMRQNLAADLAVGLAQINVKAKTAERLGALGRQEGIAVDCVVLMSIS